MQDIFASYKHNAQGFLKELFQFSSYPLELGIL